MFVPQIDGGVFDPPGFVTENRSVAHWLAPELSAPSVATLPPIVLTVLVVRVDGPVIVNVSKSSLN